jgi:hypothetical protein
VGIHSQGLPAIVEEISTLLSENYRQTVDREAITVYQTCSQLSKDIELLKERVAICEASKTEASFL